MVNEFKKELSKLSGVDFFNPKFRDVFKKYFSTDGDGSDEEEKRLKELVGEDAFEDEPNTYEEEDVTYDDIDDTENTEDIDNIEDSEDENATDDVTDKTSESNSTEDDDITDINTSADEETNTESTTEDVSDKNSSTNDSANDNSNINSELIDTKIELELVKAGVRADRLDVAKKLIKSEIHGLEDLGRVAELIKAFPEWLEGFKKEEAAPFGMSFNGSADDLTAEERRLKDVYGVDPR